ncbi:DUF4333 domain-containing protein [Pantanalinema sp. GBBB05]|uniref:DUF4333 domain-containing protein n=1 Tax=Pantanalinema sp. GBBB05 TaxID=2604139 RepID=UPI001D1D1FC1|nr:DUF4333 domain-containing protein [Pantanalinema sp. GBBB05]
MNQVSWKQTARQGQCPDRSSRNRWQQLGISLGAIALLSSCTEPPSTPPISSPNPVTQTATPNPTQSTPAATPSLAAKPQPVQKTEDKLRQEFAKTKDFTVQAINCPTNLAFQAGKSYECQVTSDAGIFIVVLQMTDAKGDFRWNTKGLLLLSKLEQYIQQTIKQRGAGDVRVDCGGKARVAKPGEAFQCKVTNAQGQTRSAKVTVKDEQGGVFLAL